MSAQFYVAVFPVMRKRFRQEFQSDEAVESSVFGLVDNTHASATELFDDSVMRNGLPNQRVGA